MLDLQKKKPLILLGDLNVAHEEIDVHDPKKLAGHACFTKEERAEMEETLQTFADTFRELYPDKHIAAKSQNKGWRLDYGIVSRVLLKCLEDNIAFEDIYDSDHCPIQIKFDKNKLNDL